MEWRDQTMNDIDPKVVWVAKQDYNLEYDMYNVHTKKHKFQ